MSAEPNTTQTEYAHIVRTEGIVGGEPRIANTRIRVRDIVLARDVQAAMPEEIVATIYPHLTLARDKRLGGETKRVRAKTPPTRVGRVNAVLSPLS